VLFHTVQRKKVDPAWTMEVDDIIACLLPEKQAVIEDLQVMHKE